jgi:hypothetical protein
MAGYTAEAQWHSWSWDQRCSAACQAQGRGLDEPGRGDVITSRRVAFEAQAGGKRYRLRHWWWQSIDAGWQYHSCVGSGRLAY